MASAHHQGANALPPTVLSHILQYVSLQQRLGHCALVSTAWAAGAAAATTVIEHRFPAKMRAGQGKAVLRWIGQHAQHATSLRLLGQGDKGTAVPFCKFLLPGLRHLHIEAVSLPALGPSAATAGGLVQAPTSASGNKPVHILLACQHLTRLELIQCRVLPSLQVLMALTVLTDLRHLRLAVKSPQTEKGGEPMTDEERALLPLPNQMWEGLTKLTHLDLAQQVEVGPSVVAHLTALTGLQELRLNAAQQLHADMRLQASCLGPLQQLQSLTYLYINAGRSNAFGDSSATVAHHVKGSLVVTNLTKLSHLAMVRGRVAIHPGVLLSLTGLQVLQLQPDTSAIEASATGNLTKLFAALAQCTMLTELRLSRLHGQPPPPASAYAALTASPGLCCLDLAHCSITEGAWQHIFPVGSQLSALQDLRLADITGALTRTELGQLPICCPGLTSLGLIRALQHDVGLDPLLKLSGLTSLAVEHGPPDDALDVLQQLTILRSLRSLSVGEPAHPITREGLLLLMVLTQLTRLAAEVRVTGWRAFGRTHSGRSQTVEITNQVAPCFLPDVWRQIHETYK